MNERETPMTDAKAELVPVWRTTEGYVDIELVDADFARTLERLCAELVDALDGQDAPDYCSCKWCEMRKQALAKYTAMKEGRL
jgi:hypothetical protein